MNKEETLTFFQEIFDDAGIFKAAGLHEENHQPHIFTITSEHLEYAKENNEGVMTEEICEKFQCGHKNCKLEYSKHESDKTLFLQLKKDTEQEDANNELIKIKEDLLKNNIKGVAFVDTEEKYRFLINGEPTSPR